MKLIFTILMLLLAAQTQAATYWARPTGTATAVDCPSDQPTAPTSDNLYLPTWEALVACMSSGDTGYLRAGDYNPPSDTPMPPSGTITIDSMPTSCTITSGPMAPSGTSTIKYTNIFGYNNEMPRIVGGIKVSNVGPREYLHFDGLDFDKNGQTGEAVWIGFSSGCIKISNSTLRGSRGGGGAGSGIKPVGLGNNIVEFNTFEDIGSDDFDHCMYVNQNKNIIRGNILRGCRGSGIKLGQAPTSGTLVDGNIVASFGMGATTNWQTGIDTASQADDNVIINNVIYGGTCPGGNRWSAGLGSYRGSNNIFANNTVYLPDPNCVGIGSVFGTNNTFKNNILYVSDVVDSIERAYFTGYGGGSTTGSVLSNNMARLAGTGIDIVGDPRFVDATNVDATKKNFRLFRGFRLWQFAFLKKSPGMDEGTDLSTIFTTSIDGTPRPRPGRLNFQYWFWGDRWDIGAYESHGLIPWKPLFFGLTIVLAVVVFRRKFRSS